MGTEDAHLGLRQIAQHVQFDVDDIVLSQLLLRFRFSGIGPDQFLRPPPDFIGIEHVVIQQVAEVTSSPAGSKTCKSTSSDVSHSNST